MFRSTAVPVQSPNQPATRSPDRRPDVVTTFVRLPTPFDLVSRF